MRLAVRQEAGGGGNNGTVTGASFHAKLGVSFSDANDQPYHTSRPFLPYFHSLTTLFRLPPTNYKPLNQHLPTTEPLKFFVYLFSRYRVLIANLLR